MLHLMLRAFFKGHMTKIHHHWLFETVHAPRIFITQEVAGGEIVLISMSTASRDSALSDSCSTSQWTHPLFCSAVLNYLNANQKTFIKKKKKKITDRGGRFLKSDSQHRPPGLYCLCCQARRLWALWNSLQCEWCRGGRHLPPVHLLHQVCTYQKACPVEAMRAVNTFRRKSSTVVKNWDFTLILNLRNSALLEG